MGGSTAGGKGDNRWAGSRLKNKNLQLTYIQHSVHFLRQDFFFLHVIWSTPFHSSLNITQSWINYEGSGLQIRLPSSKTSTLLYVNKTMEKQKCRVGQKAIWNKWERWDLLNSKSLYTVSHSNLLSLSCSFSKIALLCVCVCVWSVINDTEVVVGSTANRGQCGVHRALRQNTCLDTFTAQSDY